MSKNQYGLPRDIPVEIKRQVQENAGFGCVICGCFIFHYEHIEPEFHNAREHNVNDITLLCPNHHELVSKGQIPKNVIKQHQQSPFAKQYGFISDTKTKPLFPKSKTFILGTATFNTDDVAIKLDGVPIIWFENSNNMHIPLALCMILYDEQGNKLCYINRNEIIVFISQIKFSYKVKRKEQIGTVKIYKKDAVKSKMVENILFELQFSADQIEIVRIKMKYNKHQINIEPGKIQINQSSIFDSNGLHGITINGMMHTKSVLQQITLSPNDIIEKRLQWIYSFDKEHAGFIYDQLVLNKSLEIVGYLKNNNECYINDLFVGILIDTPYYLYAYLENNNIKTELAQPSPGFIFNNFFNSTIFDKKVLDYINAPCGIPKYLTYSKNSYDDNCPIFTNKLISSEYGYDISYRLNY